MSFALVRLKVSTNTIDPIGELQSSTEVTELQSFLRLWNVFCRFLPSFACNPTTLSKQLRKVQLQTFDRLADDKITAFGTLRAQLMELLCWIFHFCKAATHSTGGMLQTDWCILWQKELNGTDIPTGYCSRCLTKVNAHTTPPISRVSRWCRQFLLHPYFEVCRFVSGPINWSWP